MLRRVNRTNINVMASRMQRTNGLKHHNRTTIPSWNWNARQKHKNSQVCAHSCIPMVLTFTPRVRVNLL